MFRRAVLVNNLAGSLGDDYSDGTDPFAFDEGYSDGNIPPTDTTPSVISLATTGFGPAPTTPVPYVIVPTAANPAPSPGAPAPFGSSSLLPSSLVPSGFTSILSSIFGASSPISTALSPAQIAAGITPTPVAPAKSNTTTLLLVAAVAAGAFVLLKKRRA